MLVFLVMSCQLYEDAMRCSDTLFVWNFTKIYKLIALIQTSTCENEDRV